MPDVEKFNREIAERKARRLAESIAYKRAVMFNLAALAPVTIAATAAALMVTTSLATGSVSEGLKLIPDVLNNDGGMGWRMGICITIITGMAAAMPFNKRLASVAAMAASAALSSWLLYPPLTEATLNAPVTAEITQAEYEARMCRDAGIKPNEHALLDITVDGKDVDNANNIECGERRVVAFNRPTVLPGLTAPNGQPARYMRVTP